MRAQPKSYDLALRLAKNEEAIQEVTAVHLLGRSRDPRTQLQLHLEAQGAAETRARLERSLRQGRRGGSVPTVATTATEQ